MQTWIDPKTTLSLFSVNVKIFLDRSNLLVYCHAVFVSGGRMPVRLIDVARAAKVSRSTASNVFSNPERVRQVLRDRVQSAAKKLGYAGPDPKGQVLRAGKLNLIGVVMPGQWGVAETLRSQVFVQFLQGVAQACDDARANMVLLPDLPGARGVGAALVDGFIFGRIEQLGQLDSARQRRLPYVVVDFDAGPDVNAVIVDARAGMKAAVQHLIALGHRRFGMVSFLRGAGAARLIPSAPRRDLAILGITVDQEKLAGAAEALAEAGLSIDDVPVLHAEPWDQTSAHLLLDAAPEATAIFSFSAMQAIAVMKEAQRRGIKVPDDLSVIGFNDIPEAANCMPPLTTLDTFPIEKGRLAGDIVLANGPVQRRVLQPQLRIRGSTGQPPLRRFISPQFAARLKP
jgi:DNA-binding LacI/PurR family transcriptional regulator